MLLDLPTPGAEEVRWFPGGRFLVVADWFDAQRDPPGAVDTFGNDLRFAVVDLETGSWRPGIQVDSKDELGDRPWTCLGSDDCTVLVSASGRFVKVGRDDQECSPAWARSRGHKVKEILFFENVWPPALKVSHSGEYVLVTGQGYPPDPDGHRGYDYFDVQIVRTGNDVSDWMNAIRGESGFPAVWSLPDDRAILGGGWAYDQAGLPDRLPLVTAARRDPDDSSTWRLLVVEVGRQPPAHPTATAVVQRPTSWRSGPIDFSQAQKVAACYCYNDKEAP